MILKGICKCCGTEIKLDIGNMSIDEVREKLSSKSEFSCPGHHVELCPPYPAYWNIDDWELTDGSAMSEEDFLAELKNRYTEVLDTVEISARKIITGFCYGFPVTNDGHSWDFTESPSGKRYYYR